MKKLRITLISAGAAVTLNAVAASLISNMHAGIVCTYIFGAVLVCAGVFFESLPVFIRYAFFVTVGLGVVYVFLIFIYGHIDNVTYSEDAVIVLGAGLRGEDVSRSLKSRLDAAIGYHEKNPTAVIVLSGGQGEDEKIPESLAMKRYLLSAGIPEELIITESSSTSTRENFLFSKELLDDHFGEPFSAAFITNDYHTFRAEYSAKEAGFDSITHSHSPTPLLLILPSGIREGLAIIKQCILT